MDGVLKGVRVIELGQLMAAPVSSMMLADMGADVVKIEKVVGGDEMRAFGGAGAALAAPFVMVNRNKRCLALDIKQSDGQALLRRLAERADVVVQNSRLGVMEKLGLGYPQLAEVNPRLVYCSISGYGSSGPWAQRGGFDLMAQGFAGIMSVTGTPGGPPLKPGISVADVNAGVLAATGILGALFQRERTGRGQHVETSLLDASLQQMYWFAAMYFQTGVSLGASASGHPLTAPYQAFETSDGWITLGGANQPNWERIAQVLGHPEWCADERFGSGALRKQNEGALEALIVPELRKRSSAEWIEVFMSVNVPVGPIHDIGQALQHPQTRANDRIVELDHPVAGRSHAIGLPIRFSHASTTVRRSAPLLGEHSREALLDYGLSNSEIDDFVARRVVMDLTPAAQTLRTPQSPEGDHR